MNKERIKALWELHGGSFDKGDQHRWPCAKIESPYAFAEAIVKECLGKIDECEFGTDEEWDRGIRVARLRVKEYFGVSE